MAVIPLPASARFPDVNWNPGFRNQVNTSVWTGSRKVMGLPGGEKFSISAGSRPVYREKQVREWRAFVMKLRGRENHFLFPACQTQQHAGPNPSVSSAVAGNSFATLSSIPTGGLKEGMFLSFTLASGIKQLVILTADVAAGTHAIAFEFALRENASGAVEVMNPVAELAMTADTVAWSEKDGGFQIGFEAEEAFT